ncbi:MAG: hypothetical protein ACOVSR_16580 [Bacteroidia bacterium]
MDLNIKDDELATNQTNVLENLNEAVTELNLVSEGKLKARKAEDLFNEL